MSQPNQFCYYDNWDNGLGLGINGRKLDLGKGINIRGWDWGLGIGLKLGMRDKQVWLWPYEALGIVGFGLYDITIVCGPKGMSLEKSVLISQKI